MRNLTIHKFGGTSVGSAERITAAAAIIAASQQPALVVTSAMSGTTDALLRAISAAADGRADEARAEVSAITLRHHETLTALNDASGQTGTRVGLLCDELTHLIEAIVALGEASPRSKDRIVSIGEKLATELLALALDSAGRSALPLSADTFLETDARFTQASPIPHITAGRIRRALTPHLDAGTIPVVTGFIGCSAEGHTTTLGRGGSDFSATLIGAALNATDIIIWTDVPGVFTANPRIVPEALAIPQLHHREAAELSFYGAKVLHQRTIQPVSGTDARVWIKSSFEPHLEGTLVDRNQLIGSHPVKAISAVPGQAIVNVEGRGMAGVPGIAARIFGALARHEISVTLICQSSSEASICFAIPTAEVASAETALKQELRIELAEGSIDDITILPDCGILAVVGLGMAHTTGVAARVMTALAKQGVSLIAIAQASSELNISVVIRESQIPEATRALHRAFELHRLDTGKDAGGHLDIILFGVGKIARALVENLDRHAPTIRARYGLIPRLVAVGDRSGYLLQPSGLDPASIADLLRIKAAGGPITDLAGATASSDPRDLLRASLRYRLSHPTLVDLSDAAVAADLYDIAFAEGCDVVTANKKPLATPPERYNAMRDLQRTGARILRAEATVGAGLPVIDTLEMLLATGDRIHRVDGSLSGTLAFLMERLESGQPFSEAVRDAEAGGYTEPDPVADLTGDDVVRKAIIISRIGGLSPGHIEIEQEGWVDGSLAGLPLPVLLERLKAYDKPIADRLAAARERGEVVRFVASVEPGRIRVGPQSLPLDAPLARLARTDNMIVIASERYDQRPLVVTGPGAGVQVTAMGVLSDILRIIAERG